MAEYDLGEARELMARYGLNSGDRDASNEANEANAELLNALKKMNVYGFTVTIKDGTATFASFTGSQVQVIYSPSGSGCYKVSGTHKRTATLREPSSRALKVLFDPNAKMFCGADFDERIAPEPGKPRPRRSAVAIIVEAVLDTFKSLDG